MSGDNLVVFLILLILAIFFAFGCGAGQSSYKHDTFDCTNICGGKHSIQYYVENNKVCYCEVR
jgi:hypothetical protein